MNKPYILLTFTFLLSWAVSFAQPVTAPALKEAQPVSAYLSAAAITGIKCTLITASDFPIEGTGFYRHKSWLAVNPNTHKSATTQLEINKIKKGKYDLLFSGVGEYDGASEYQLYVNGKIAMKFTVPLSKFSYQEGVNYSSLVKNIQLQPGDQLKVTASVGSIDGIEYSRARWGGLILVKEGKGKKLVEKLKDKGTAQTLTK